MTPSDTGATRRLQDRGWRAAYLIGGIAAFLAVAGMLTDIALTMLPGWGAASVPATALAWFDQFASTPLLGMRNLDALNIAISIVALPMYVALYGAHRRSAAGLALAGLVFVSVGTAVFVAANAALPMLELSRQYATAGAAERAALLSSAYALLARGAHGSLGAFPGFFISEVGTLLAAIAMLAGGVFSRKSGWIGIAGVLLLVVYTAVYTFVAAEESVMMALAIPGGLLMIVWYVLVGRRLLQLRTTRETLHSAE